MLNAIYNRFRNDLMENVDLKRYNTFRIGGTAKVLLEPKSVDMFVDMINTCKNNGYDYKIIGNGSNVLFQDKSYDEIIITTRKMRSITIGKDEVKCDCGVSIPQLAVELYSNSLSGLERLCNVPATVGGAVVMNAGAYGSEVKDTLKEVTVCTQEGTVLNVRAEDLDLSYRNSNVKEKGYIILSAVFTVREGDKYGIKSVMDECRVKRTRSQPLEYPNAGSIFKKEGDILAGKAIDDCELKGYKVGGAMVSEKHANFIVNHENATCSDVLNLIEHIKNKVYAKFGISLHTEVEII